MLGENLANGEGYTLWGQPHVHVPPGFPLLLAGLQRLGVDSYLGLNLAMMLIAWGTLFCCYRALCELVSPAFAKCLICLVAFSHAMHLASVCLLSDIPFMAVVWLGIWCQLHGLRTGSRTLEAGSLLLLAACGIRIVGVPIAIGAALGMLLHSSPVSRRRILMNAGGTALGMALVMGLSYFYVHSIDREHSLPGYHNSLLYHLGQLGQSIFLRPLQNVLNTAPELSSLLTGQKNSVAGSLIAAIWLPMVVGAVVCWKRGQQYGICILCIYLLTLLILRPLLARYFLPLSPFIFWYSLEGVRWVGDRTLNWQRKGVFAACSCMVLLLILNVPKACKLPYRLHFPKSDNVYEQQRSLEATARFLRQEVRPEERFITNCDERMLAYLSGTWTIPSAEREITKHKSRSEMILHNFRLGARYVVVREYGKSRYTRKFRNAVSAFPGSQLVFSTGDSQVYRLNAQLPIQNANHSSKYKRAL
jgi:hypothetical protein